MDDDFSLSPGPASMGGGRGASEDLAALCLELETRGRDGALEGVGNLVARVEVELGRVLHALGAEG